ncbi:CU044_2847 family protein [Streptomyces sp. NPDC058572]|uniref:CU044_2847 family protein n=1 Tax=Streptomyces sp. NPDC058572 TaxID=3346546 RepID=UPI00364E2727
MSQLVQLAMPDGQMIWATVDEDEGPSDSGIGEKVVEKLQGFQQSLHAVASNVRTAVADACPNEVSVEFGLELAVGQDGIMAAVAGGGGKAAFKVTLTWNEQGLRPAPAVSEPSAQVPQVPPTAAQT